MLSECCLCIFAILIIFYIIYYNRKEGLEVCVSKSKFDDDQGGGSGSITGDAGQISRTGYDEDVGGLGDVVGSTSMEGDGSCAMLNLNRNQQGGLVNAADCYGDDPENSPCSLIEIDDADITHFTELCGQIRQEEMDKYLQMKCIMEPNEEEQHKYCEILNVCELESNTAEMRSHLGTCGGKNMEYDIEFNTVTEGGGDFCIYSHGPGRGERYYSLTQAEDNYPNCDDGYIKRVIGEPSDASANDYKACLPCQTTTGNGKYRVWKDGVGCVNPQGDNMDLDKIVHDPGQSVGVNESITDNPNPKVLYKSREPAPEMDSLAGDSYFYDSINSISCTDINNDILNKALDAAGNDELRQKLHENLSGCAAEKSRGGGKCYYIKSEGDFSQEDYLGLTLTDNTIFQCGACNQPESGDVPTDQKGAQADAGKHYVTFNDGVDIKAYKTTTEVLPDGIPGICSPVCADGLVPVGINDSLLTDIDMNDGGTNFTVDGQQLGVYCAQPAEGGENIIGCLSGHKMHVNKESNFEPIYSCVPEDRVERVELGSLNQMMQRKTGDNTYEPILDPNNAYGLFTCNSFGYKDKGPMDTTAKNTILLENAETISDFHTYITNEGNALCEQVTCDDYSCPVGRDKIDGARPTYEDGTPGVFNIDLGTEADFSGRQRRPFKEVPIDELGEDAVRAFSTERTRVKDEITNICCEPA